MGKKESLLLWILGIILSFEMLVLSSLVYFATLPFFLLLFIVLLKMLSLFLIGFIVLFLFLTLLGKKPEEMIKSWLQNARESMRFLGSSFALVAVAFPVCVMGGALVVFLLKKMFAMPFLATTVNTMQLW
ncbi:MAG: hypothetical protein KBA46_08210, partial [Candidatus Omnitrophica bacterium]|nr:hypothetical protein [Candidatus Omnitrophota bacterium]